MSYTTEFIVKLKESEFQFPYTQTEIRTVRERLETIFEIKLHKAIQKASEHRGLKFNILNEIHVSGEEITIGNIIIQINKREN